ncbi:hypothetical protein AwErysi_01690 [Erysipelotrichaceae bacterium]|nr:hypothetical protein AwErysi_01690 [Erysipelotrichaceae bacterium]
MAYAHTLFTIDEELIKSIGGKELLLFDDVLTTGATMVAAYKSFEKIGITQVQSFSIFR